MGKVYRVEPNEAEITQQDLEVLERIKDFCIRGACRFECPVGVVHECPFMACGECALKDTPSFWHLEMTNLYPQQTWTLVFKEVEDGESDGSGI